MEPLEWPADADGDVLRNLAARGFDFSREYVVDFNIDFDEEPSLGDLSARVMARFPAARVEWLDDENCLLVKVSSRLTYEFVIDTQKELSDIAGPWGGQCDSWGVLA